MSRLCNKGEDTQTLLIYKHNSFREMLWIKYCSFEKTDHINGGEGGGLPAPKRGYRYIKVRCRTHTFSCQGNMAGYILRSCTLVGLPTEKRDNLHCQFTFVIQVLLHCLWISLQTHFSSLWTTSYSPYLYLLQQLNCLH